MNNIITSTYNLYAGASSNTSMENFAAGNAEGFPPPGVTILAVPVGGQPGNYRCDLCSVVLGSESVLEAHLVSPDHVAKAKGGKVSSYRNI